MDGMPQQRSRKSLATISHLQGERTRVRLSRGFSRQELEAAGILPRDAGRPGIHVDHRQRTKYEFNMSMLHKIISEPRARPAAEDIRISEEAR